MKIHKNIRNFINALAIGVALLGATFGALADKLYLKDGRVLDGTLVRQDSNFVVFSVNGKQEIFEAADVVRIEKTEAKETEKKADEPKEAAKPAEQASKQDPAAAPAASAPADAKKNDPKGKQLTGKPARIAIIPFGPPQSWKNDKKLADVDTLVGGEISIKPWMDIIPMLKKDGVDTVVVLINSGGGMLLEMERFPAVFREYKKNFRTVAWVESAISAAAMSPWIIPEFYMKPGGNIGGCTGYSGPGVAIKGVGLLKILDDMAKLSIEAGRDPLIMRAMQIQQPLSANIDEATGKVTFFGDSTSGKYVINPDGQVLTLNSEVARKIKFSSGTAADKEELARLMGLTEFEFGGDEAVKHMEDFLLKAHRAMAFFVDTATKYILARNAAVQLAQNPNDPRFGSELGKARQALSEMQRQVKINPNFPMLLGQNVGAQLTPEWFEQQEEQLRELARRAREAEERRRRER